MVFLKLDLQIVKKSSPILGATVFANRIMLEKQILFSKLWFNSMYCENYALFISYFEMKQFKLISLIFDSYCKEGVTIWDIESTISLQTYHHLSARHEDSTCARPGR